MPSPQVTSTIVYTADDLRSKISAILSKYPFLADVHEDCCRCCVEEDVREKGVPGAVRAWLELEAWRDLLGDGKDDATLIELGD